MNKADTQTDLTKAAPQNQENREPPLSSIRNSPAGGHVDEPPKMSRLHDLDDSIVPLPKGQRLGPYEVRGLLGVGGFGITYRALDLHLKHHVALKEFFPVELAKRGERQKLEPRTPLLADLFAFGKRFFLEEARTLARFKHPNIVRVLSFFQANNTAYFAMDFEVGQNLKRILTSKGRLEEDELIELLHPLLNGLETMHGQGFIHRDIKPGNIYVRKSGVPVLLDFGAALRPEHGAASVGRTMLTPGYAPPEQYDRSTLLGPWTDIYGMAAVLHCAVSGTKPVESIIRKAAQESSHSDPLLPAAEIGKDAFSPQFLAAIDRGMRIDSDQRPQTVAQWRALFPAAKTDRSGARPLQIDQDNTHLEVAQEVESPPLPSGLESFRRGILVSSDPENVRIDSVLLQTLLQMRVEHATTSTEVLALLHSRHADIILCDDTAGEAGFAELLEHTARKLLWTRPPIVLLHRETADPALYPSSIARGVSACIQRPYEMEDLEQALVGIAKMQQTYAVEESLLADAFRLAAQGRHGRALKLFADVLGMEEEANSLGEPGYTELSWRGMRHLALREYVQAVNAFARARGMLQLLAEAYGGMGESYRLTGSMERYLESAKKAAYQGKRYERMLVRRCELAAILSESAETETENEIISAGKALGAQGLRLLRIGDCAGALGAFNQALTLIPDDPALYLNIARTHCRLRNHKATMAHLDKALRLDPVFAPALRLRTMLENGDWPQPETI